MRSHTHFWPPWTRAMLGQELTNQLQLDCVEVGDSESQNEHGFLTSRRTEEEPGRSLMYPDRSS